MLRQIQIQLIVNQLLAHRRLAKNDSFLVNDANPTIIHNNALITANTSMTTSQYIRVLNQYIT